MKVKFAIAAVFMAAMLGSTAIVPDAFAQGAKKSTLVALGDSISFGYNLGNNKAPSPEAFPFLVGAADHLAVNDLGVPGATTADLLESLKTSTFQNDLKSASVITLGIGSNDILHAAGPLIAEAVAHQTVKLTPQVKASLEEAALNAIRNLPKIIDAIRKDTSAPILLLNLYDPFADSSALHTATEQVLPMINQAMELIAVQNKCFPVDTYKVFNNRQQQLILPNDVHPNKLGQQLLAATVESDIVKMMTMAKGSSQGSTQVNAQGGGAGAKSFSLTLNGVPVQNPVDEVLLDAKQPTMLSSVSQFATAYGVTYHWNPATKVLILDGKPVAKTFGAPAIIHGQLVAPTTAMGRAVAQAIGGGVVVAGIDQSTLTANFTILPPSVKRVGVNAAGVVQYAFVPAKSSFGPIYGVQNGRLTFIEYVFKPSDLQASTTGVAFIDRLPTPSVDHVDFVWNSEANLGLPAGHVEEYLYFTPALAALASSAASTSN